MGAWGGLCIFDHARFVGEVAPALRAGEEHPLIAAEIARGAGRKRFDLGAFRGLAAVMACFDERLTECSLGRAFGVRDGVVVEPGSHACDWGYEALCALFERVVTWCCVTHVANIGREYRASFSLSAQFGVQGGDSLTAELVGLLDARGAYWTHGSGGFSEGVHGWLDADECKLLGLGLPALRPDPDAADPSADAERIHRIARIAETAARLRKGLLWGADLPVLHPAWREYARGEHEPIVLP